MGQQGVFETRIAIRLELQAAGAERIPDLTIKLFVNKTVPEGCTCEETLSKPASVMRTSVS
ncbi:hypothetical protein MHLP_02220 [Candidatus Mycoplasma haematolamae str. Purdue]|uniref:Uncharacterized protein n=1 Tax=Mycoplasma haematolamae (strain Purdue) TaxID=1212765 RepID=I7CJJ3_MYCHA|nr:hypothetical protein MHLP_02220 [Candidatus Mycoplasma haematolamae str. Purdue]